MGMTEFLLSKIYYSILVRVHGTLCRNDQTHQSPSSSRSRCPPRQLPALHLIPRTLCAPQGKTRFPCACALGKSKYIFPSCRWCCSLLHAAASVRPACSTASFNNHSSITAVLSPLPFNQAGPHLQSIADSSHTTMPVI